LKLVSYDYSFTNTIMSNDTNRPATATDVHVEVKETPGKTEL